MIITEDIKKISKETKRKLVWEMFYNCNGNCSYCFQRERRDNKIPIDVNKLKEASLKIKEFIIKNKIDRISLAGGEISILKNEDLKQIINSFVDIDNLEICIITNFFRSVEYYSNLIKGFTKKINFSLSYHVKDMKGFFDKVENFIKCSPNADVSINYVMESRLETKKFFYFFNKLKKKYEALDLHLIIKMQPLYNKEKSNFYGFDQDKEKIFKLLNDKNINKYIGWKNKLEIEYTDFRKQNLRERELLKYGKEYLIKGTTGFECSIVEFMIEPDGGVYPACYDKMIFNILKEDIPLFKNGIFINKCNTDRCMCDFLCIEKK